MKNMPTCGRIISALAIVIAISIPGPFTITADAFDQWSTARTSGNCADCHGSFLTANYVPLAAARQGIAWTAGLHNAHRNAAPNNFLNGNCNACHTTGALFPVLISSSSAVSPFNQSCNGCHNGAGTRLHHELTVGAGTCSGCHGPDTTGNEKTPLPPVYTAALGTTNGTTRINNPCNDGTTGRVFEGGFFDLPTVGLDNDGDNLYDQNDPDCAVVTPEMGAQCFDGIDNDGDGAVDCADPGCAGATGPATNCGVGACATTGNQACQGGQLVNTCTPLPAGTEGPFGNATCADGIDNNCNGLTDAADPGCAQVCIPQAEVCDGLDNNCDGIVDNSIAPVPSTCGTGNCAATGQITCVAGQPVDSCVPGTPQTEICNNQDDNCDGIIDNIASVPTTCGIGACASTGQTICQNGAPVDTCTPLPVGVEGPFASATCSDGIDNDCDGLTDAADPGCAQACVPTQELCDGIDNDCDGIIDNNIPPVDITCGAGACLNTGTRVCINGALQDQCTPLPPGTEGPFDDATCTDGIDNNCNGLTDAADPGCAQSCVPTQEICDGIDNDCDGIIDNNLPAMPTTCGVGACASTGQSVCQNGQLIDTCVPLQAGNEGPFGNATCTDNIDNDCDTLVDAADPGCAVPPVEEACFDQGDNDNDGLTDCADPDCAGEENGSCDTGLSGPCAEGEVQCVNGASACVQQEFPRTEICDDGRDNDCDGATDATDSDCRQHGDFDIKSFSAMPRIDICGPSSNPKVRLLVVLKNTEKTAEKTAACFNVTVVGTLGENEIYHHIMNICLKTGKTAEVAFPEPDLATLRAGTITWTASIADGNGDIDSSTQKTRVVCVNGRKP